MVHYARKEDVKDLACYEHSLAISQQHPPVRIQAEWPKLIELWALWGCFE